MSRREQVERQLFIDSPRQARAADRSWRRMLTASEAVAAFGTPNALAVARWYRKEAQDTRRALDGYVARGGKMYAERAIPAKTLEALDAARRSLDDGKPT